MAGCLYELALLRVARRHQNAADFVIPAVAGMAYVSHWMPAFAGMTISDDFR